MLEEIKDNVTREQIIAAIRAHCKATRECDDCPIDVICRGHGVRWGEAPNEALAEAAAKIAASRSGGAAAEAKHYQVLPVQPIEIMQKLMSQEQFLGFCLGNIIKYSLRCGHKDSPTKEIEKVRQYADWYVRAAAGEMIDPRRAA